MLMTLFMEWKKLIIQSKENNLLIDRQYGYGADVLRFWVAAADNLEKNYEEIKISNEDIGSFETTFNYELDIKSAEINLIRKIYWNILRFIGDLKLEFDPSVEKRSPVFCIRLYNF